MAAGMQVVKVNVHKSLYSFERLAQNYMAEIQ